MYSILQRIVSNNNLQLNDVRQLQDGAINKVYLLNCKDNTFVIKLNEASTFPDMSEAEFKGLELLRKSSSFKIPKVLSHGNEENTSYLIMEYISNEDTLAGFWDRFAEQLVSLHKTTNKQFGLNHNNYIGSLPQSNATETTASQFYINQRIVPQIKLASDNGYSFSTIDNFYKNILNEIPNEKPALIHGDLWNGNYLVSKINDPVLIDPAISFASREMDLSMMSLFGGFPEKVYASYNEQFPLIENWQDRIAIWQLYYLLVHLNLFGSGYFSQVKSIIKHYS